MSSPDEPLPDWVLNAPPEVIDGGPIVWMAYQMRMQPPDISHPGPPTEDDNLEPPRGTGSIIKDSEGAFWQRIGAGPDGTGWQPFGAA